MRDKGQRPDFAGVFFDRTGVESYHAPAMSQGRLPELIDPYRYAETRRMLRGRIRIASMKRLGAYLADREGEVDVELEFGIDDEGVRFACGRVWGELSVICQRCLSTMNVPVDAEICLGVIWDESLAERLPEHYEPLLVGDEPIHLSDIVEDELILALPVVPRHADERCAGAMSSGPESDPEEPKRENPFGDLAKLKINRKP